MDLHEAHACLQRVTYKPRFDLEVSDLGYDFCTLRMLAEVQNANSPERRIPIFRTASLPIRLLGDEAEFFRVVRMRVQEFEMHEVDEFFRVDGACLVDPHPERVKA